MTELIARVSEATNSFLGHTYSICSMFMSTLYWTFVAPLRIKTYEFREVVTQMDRVGVQSFFIVFLVMSLIGVILVLQTAYLVEPYGQLDMVPGGVAISLTREIGPLLVAILVTGRVGAAFTAELGAMNTADELMALEVMAINPIGYLISPRFLAVLVMLPVLTVYGNLAGMTGGWVIGHYVYDIAHSVYLQNTIDSLKMKDVVSGMLKPVVFAVVVTMISCYKAFTVKGGGSGVGKATMEAVVVSIIGIICSDALFTGIITKYFP